MTNQDQWALSDSHQHKIVIDVRTREEFQDGAVPGSLWIPLDTFRDRIETCLQMVPTGAQVILMCKSGMRASYAYGTVQALGLQTDYAWSVYEGGMVQWKAQGLPVALCSALVSGGPSGVPTCARRLGALRRVLGRFLP